MESWWRSRWIRSVLPRKNKNPGVWHKGKRYMSCPLKWLTGLFTDAGIKLHHVRSVYQIVRTVLIYRLTVNSVFCLCTRICNAKCLAVKCLIQDLYLIGQLLFVTSITTSLCVCVCGQSAEWATLWLTKLTDCENLILYRPCIALDYTNWPTRCTFLVCSSNCSGWVVRHVSMVCTKLLKQ
jgi:hypothetical protein